MDAFIGTGNRARMAIQVIIDHHVPQQNICYITLESSARGIINLAKVFPNVQVLGSSLSLYFVCSLCSAHLNETNKPV